MTHLNRAYCGPYNRYY